jgi:polyisoprenyl-teichoic acid--peptidoglycan teichoic acid transferase
VRKRGAFAIAALVAWTLGSALGAIAPSSSEASADAPILLSAAHAGHTPLLTGDRPISILAIGSGARPYQSPERGLADSIHLIEIDPKNRHAVIIGIPRDSWVSIPGHGTNKINASMAIGGPPLLVETVERLSGIHIQYFALTSFWGLTSMIDQIGGLTIRVPFPMHDRFSRSDFHPGVQRLRGGEVLAFSRDRHSLRSGDFGRSEDGGRVFTAALTQFRREFDKDPSTLLRWVSAGMRSLSTDLPLSDVLRLAFLCTRISPRNVQNVVLPGGVGSANGVSIVRLSPAVRTIFRDASRSAIVRHRPPSPTAGQ